MMAIDKGFIEMASILLKDKHLNKKKYKVKHEECKFNLLEFFVMKGLKELILIILPLSLRVSHIHIFEIAISFNDSEYINFL